MSKPLGDDPLLRAVPEIDGYKVLGPCVLYGRIGAGGMGAVYRGRHMNLDLDVAVKCLKPSLMEENAEFVIRFRNEARFAATLNDPHLVRVFDVDEQHGLHYLVMEYVRGETLNERVQRKGPLSEKEAARILLDAARGLASAHRAGVVHRDIKPDNILISVRGDVKVADLGLAKAMDGGSGLTKTRTVMGTPQYMAPEQWESTRDLGPSADVWALGCTLYFMLAGHAPIASGEFVQVMRRVCFESFPDLPESLTSVPESLRAVLQRCTAKDPAKRFPNAMALAAALASVAEETGSLADDGAGSGSLRCATVSPPPGETLARIRLQIKADRTPTPPGPAVVPEPGIRPNDTAAPAPQRRRATSALVRALTLEAFPGDDPPTRVRRRVAVWFLMAALLATAGIGYAKGWFQGGTKRDLGSQHKTDDGPKPEGPANPAPSTSKPNPKDDDRKDPLPLYAAARRDLDDPVKLDGAIDSLREALTLKSDFPEAKEALALALRRRAMEQRKAEEPLEAWRTLREAIALEGTPSPAAIRLRDDLRSEITKSVLEGLSFDIPVAGQVTKVEPVLVQGTVKVLSSVQIYINGGQAISMESGWPKRVVLRSGQNLWGLVHETYGAPSAAAMLKTVIAQNQIDPRMLKAGMQIVMPAPPGWAQPFGLALKGLPEGPTELAVELIVENDLSVKSAIEFLIDRTPPVFTIDEPKDGATVRSPVVVKGRVQDATAVTLKVDDKPVEVRADGTFTVEIEAMLGPCEIPLSATDAAGNTAAPQACRVQVDSRPIVLMVVEPAAGFRTSESAVVVLLKADRQGVEVAGPGGSETLAQESTGTKIRLALAQEGESSFTFRARDAAGNLGTATFTVVRDTTGPVLTITSPTAGTAVTAGETITCIGSATDPSGLAAVTVNGAPATLADGGGWSFSVKAPAAAGAFAVTFVAADALGNRREEPRIVDIRPAKPPAPSWCEVEREDPDPAVVTDAAFRQKLVDLKLPWQVKDKKTGIRMRLVAPGTYLRGSPDSEAQRSSDEGPQHHVTLMKPFYAGIYEVNQGEWQQVMGSNPSSFKGDPRLPVEMVSWNDGAEGPASFCAKTGLRLLTEAEWEYLCRAGTTTPFSFGATISPHQANYDGNFTYGNGPEGAYRQKTTAVGSFPANAWGFHDLHGNVWEWVADGYNAAEYRRCQGGVSDPICPTQSSSRVLRGGSWYGPPRFCRSAFRISFDPSNSRNGVGIRVARAPYP